MINLFVYPILLSVNLFAQSSFWEYYTIIPPLGRVKSITSSPFHIYALNDNYLLIFDKPRLALSKTIHFDEDVSLVGYDQQYNDVWILGTSHIIRLTAATYSMAKYTLTDKIARFGIGKDYLYLDGVKDYSLSKRTGEVELISIFPGDAVWFEKITDSDIKRYAFLSPYYYNDEPEESEAPFHQFPITALYDDGSYLYVGTDGYGILKYSKLSWEKQRIIYGPLDSKIRKAKRFNNTICLVTSQGISYYPTTTDNWKYRRFTHQIIDLLFLDNKFIIGFQNQISRVDGSVILSIGNFTADVHELNSDDQHVYVGTNSGLFKMYKGTSELLPFGPNRSPVYAIHSTQDEIFIGGEFAFYKYSKKRKSWSKVLPYGVKGIVEIEDELYLLGVNNQVMKYKNIQAGDSGYVDSNWTLLPYFNIYQFDTDSHLLYCASYAGIYYYEPETEHYRVIYNLPRIKYDYVFIIEDNIVAVSRNTIYSLPLKYRD